MDRRITVLIADDDQYRLRFLPKICQRLGCRVETATDDKEIIGRLAEAAFDCIVVHVTLLDIVTAQLDRVTQTTGSRPVVVGTTSRVIDVDQRGKLFQVGDKLLATGTVDVFLRQPISSEDLELALDQVQSLIAKRCP